MSSANFLGLLLVLVFPHVSCSVNYAGRSAGSMFQAFNSYIPNQNQGTPRSYGAPGYGQPSQSLHQVSRPSSHVQPVSSSASLPENVATVYPASGGQYKTSSEFGKLYWDRSKSSLTTPSIVSSGGIIMVQDSKESHKPDKSLAAKKPLIRHDASSRLSNSNLSNFKDHWSSGMIWSGSTSSNSLYNEALGNSAVRGNQKNGNNLVSRNPSLSGFSTVNGQGSSGFGLSQGFSGSVVDGAAPVFRSNDQKIGSAYPVQKQLQTAAAGHFGLPQTPRCVNDIPDIYGLGSIRRCPRLDGSTQISTQSDFSSESSLNQFTQNYPSSRFAFSGKTAGFAEAIQTSYGTEGRTSSASNSPVSLQTGSGGNQLVPGVTKTGNSNQAIVPPQHSQSSHNAHLFYPRYKQENTRSGNHVVTKDVPKFTNAMQSHYSTPILGTAAQPGNYLPSAVNSGNLPSFSMSGLESGQVSGGASRSSFYSVHPVSDPSRTSQGRPPGAWTSENGSTSGSNGHHQRFLSGNIPATTHRTPASGLYRGVSALSGDDSARRLKHPGVTVCKRNRAV